MCGIFGYVLPSSDERRPSLADAVVALRHRGPDDSGTFETLPKKLVCGLGHTRLAILDLSAAGHQPMSTPNGRYTVVFNGEIYNFAEVRRDLESHGVHFRSHTDTEVLLEAYVRWGADCIQRLHGMFAFGIWDDLRQRLFLARDRLGVKPLYYVRSASGGIVFSSEVRALLATGVAERKLSAAGLESYLAYGSVREPDTILRNVQTLLPGHFLEHGEDGTTTRGYWHPPPETQHEVEADWAIERTRSLLQRAVDLRLVADVPVGVFLSGGMDSSAIVTLASRHATEPVHTFTLSFDEAAWDERHFARHVAERFGCKHHDVVLPAQRALQEIDGALAAQDQPSADGMNSYFVSKAARGAGLAVALSGIGADEVFGGYSYFRIFAYAWRARRLLGLLGGGTMARWTSVRHVPQSFRKLISMGGVHPDPGSFYAAIRSMFTAEQVHQIIRSDFRQPATYDDAWVPSQTSLEEGRTDAIQAWSLMELGNYLRNTLLRDTDAMGMAHSLEVREPFLDHLVVEHVTSLPARLKLGRNAKKPHLAAAVPEVPAMVKNRDKMGFTLPFDVWLRGPLRSWAEERLLAAMPQMKCLDRTVVDQMWRRFLSDSSHITQSRIWCLVSLLEWMQRHRIET